MHQVIREHLEEHLRGPARQVPQEFHAHLAACEDCAIELRLMAAQADMLQALRSEESFEPRPGFYGRVMDRIAAQAPASIWSVFLQPGFGRRLAMASAALVVLLGTYLITTEASEHADSANSAVVLNNEPVVSTQSAAFEQDGPRQQRQRDALLVDLASYHDDSLPSLRQ